VWEIDECTCMCSTPDKNYRTRPKILHLTLDFGKATSRLLTQVRVPNTLLIRQGTAMDHILFVTSASVFSEAEVTNFGEVGR